MFLVTPLKSNLMNDYIVVYNTSAKIPLNSVRSGKNRSTLKFGHGREFTYNPIQESELCTLIFGNLMREDWVSWINGMFDNNLEHSEINDFATKFKTTHSYLEKFGEPLKAIPLIATDDTYCELVSPMFEETVKLTKQEEELLLRMLVTRKRPSESWTSNGSLPNITLMDALDKFFSVYCEERGIVTKREEDRQNAGHELARHFCLLHGLEFRYAQRNWFPDSPKPEPEPPEWVKRFHEECERKWREEQLAENGRGLQLFGLFMMTFCGLAFLAIGGFLGICAFCEFVL